ncbi:transglycosylase domain-containing protein [Kroppenstedtia sanguinis]|uniref:Transglycosylase domain-containing protein n=1 Tax=Kroppenstedtia sanguinis TaxID=1380684 RepID=A0ABW4CAF9_9BACL
MNARKLKSMGRLFWKAMMTKKWWMLVLSTTLLIIMGGCTAVMMTTNLYDLESLKNMQFVTTIYDHQEKKATTLGDEQREYVELDKVKTPDLAKTFVYVEDERFYKHNGADLKGLGRALAVDLLTMSPAEGGSTITMQVARNLILNDKDKTFMRKVSEITLAYNLERKYTKKEILEGYLNYIYLGNSVSGIQMASKIYFGKDLTKEKLEPHEVALLAGLPKAPEGYNPYQNPKAAKQRRNVVLKKMAEFELITEEEKEKYQKKDLGIDQKHLNKYKKPENFQAYREHLLKEAEERYGLNSQELVNGRYKIYTGLNKKAQLSLERALKDDSFYKGSDKLDAGATLIDPKTGAIAAIGGGRHYLPGFPNRALAPIQPGSSIKPLTVYAPAIQDKGYNENSMVSDDPFTYKGWSPRNMDRTFHGTVPLKVVVAKSLNASTARLLTEVVGIDKGYKYGQKLGLNLESADKSPAPLALGGLTKGVNTVQMAQAYSTFAHNGKYNEAHTITKILDVDGNLVQPKKKVKKDVKVFSKDTSQTMTRILKYAVDYGSGQNAQLPDGRDVAGKTGTTQGSKIAWFVGYTPEYLMATTVFNDNGGQVDLTGGEYPARIFHQVMSDAVKGTKVSRFKTSSGGGTSKGNSNNSGDGGWKTFHGDDNQGQQEQKRDGNNSNTNPDPNPNGDNQGQPGDPNGTPPPSQPPGRPGNNQGGDDTPGGDDGPPDDGNNGNPGGDNGGGNPPPSNDQGGNPGGNENGG